jgi:EF hand domain-containing protein
MKKSKLMMMALALSLAAITMAQDAPPNGDRPAPPDAAPNGPRPPGGPGRDGFRPPMSPLEQALDADHDGIISAEEIANASAALKKLDKNGDGKLTPDEFRPMFRRGGRGPGGPGFEGPGPGNPPPGEGPDRPRRGDQ